MSDKKTTNAVKLTTVEKNKALMAKYKREKNNKTNTKSSKSNRNTLKKTKRMVDRWGNPTTHNKKTNSKNLKFVKKTGNEVLAGKDVISKTFSTIAGGAVTGGLAAVSKAKGLIKTAKVIKTAGKVKKGNSVT
jgi:hypothetical protein